MARASYALRIKERIQQIERIIASAQRELDELRVAERVINRFGNDEEAKGPDDGQIKTSTTRGGTVIDMAIDCLTSIGPLDSLSILRYLQENWRADLKQTTLASTLSRAKSEGKIHTVNGVWHVSDTKKEPPEGGPFEIDLEVSASNVDDGVTEHF